MLITTKGVLSDGYYLSVILGWVKPDGSQTTLAHHHERIAPDRHYLSVILGLDPRTHGKEAQASPLTRPDPAGSRWVLVIEQESRWNASAAPKQLRFLAVGPRVILGFNPRTTDDGDVGRLQGAHPPPVVDAQGPRSILISLGRYAGSTE
ncbi:hypothetical protein, partial [Phyllobacterium sophorae]|uniref:hypothetical protein n=1 Tax=Phyllobacterium sophorae TaxID=1520277 RepID=UPI001AECBAC1